MSVADIDLKEANEILAGLTAEDRVLWAMRVFGNSAVLLSSMQKTSSVLHHIFYRHGLDNDILFVDTQYHFRETLELRDLFIRRYMLNIVTLYPEISPEKQELENGCKMYRHADAQPRCCQLRKEAPFLKYMVEQKKKLVIGGLRKEEGGKRKNLSFLSADPRFDGYCLYPLLDWSREQVDDLLRREKVPVHPLHSQSYPSIGCECCTTPVAPNENPRAGRWRHLREETGSDNMYCGINFCEGSGI